MTVETRRSRVLAARYAAFLLIPTTAIAGHMAKDLEDGDLLGSGNVDVIIQFNSRPTARHHQKVIARGGALKQDLGSIIPGAAYHVPGHALAELAADPDVAYISPDRPVQSLLNYVEPSVNANIAYSYGYDGRGISSEEHTS